MENDKGLWEVTLIMPHSFVKTEPEQPAYLINLTTPFFSVYLLRSVIFSLLVISNFEQTSIIKYIAAALQVHTLVYSMVSDGRSRVIDMRSIV